MMGGGPVGVISVRSISGSSSSFRSIGTGATYGSVRRSNVLLSARVSVSSTGGPAETTAGLLTGLLTESWASAVPAAVADSARSSVNKGRFISAASEVQKQPVSFDFSEDNEYSALRL